MSVEDALRTVSFALVRFSSFSANALILGTVPILLLVVRPCLARLDAERWQQGTARLGRRFEAIIQAALVASAMVTLLALLLQVVLVSNLRGGDIDSPSLESVLETSFGQWHVARLLMLAALAVLLVGRVGKDSVARQGPTPVWWAMWGVLGIAVLATSSFSGHASVATPRSVALANDIVHLIAGATWFAGIVLLAAVLPDAWRGMDRLQRLELQAPAVFRFSQIALASILVLVGTGTLNSFLNVGAPDDLVDSGYGRTLVFKLVFFMGILGLGAVNHLFLRRRLVRARAESSPTAAQAIFRRTIAAELAVAVAVFGATGVLTGLARTRQTPPPVEQTGFTPTSP